MYSDIRFFDTYHIHQLRVQLGVVMSTKYDWLKATGDPSTKKGLEDDAEKNDALILSTVCTTYSAICKLRLRCQLQKFK